MAAGRYACGELWINVKPMLSAVEIPARPRITVREVIGEIFITVGVLLLISVVFPWLSPLMPYNDVAV